MQDLFLHPVRRSCAYGQAQGHEDRRISLSFIMNRRLRTGFIVSLRVTSQCRIFKPRAFVLILLTLWWLWQQQNVSSLDSIAHATSLGARQFGESIQRFPITITLNSMNAGSSEQYANGPWQSVDKRGSCTRGHKLDHDGPDGPSVILSSGEARHAIDILTVFNCVSMVCSLLQISRNTRFSGRLQNRCFAPYETWIPVSE